MDNAKLYTLLKNANELGKFKRSDFAEFLALDQREQQKILAKLSLDYKWELDDGDLSDRCAFCYAANIAFSCDVAAFNDENLVCHISCNNCLCPTKICNSTGTPDLFSSLHNRGFIVQDIKNYPEYKELVNILKQYL